MTGSRGVRALAWITWAYLAWSLLPVVATIASSFHPDPYAAGVGLDAYRAALRDADTRAALEQSVVLAVGTVLVAVPIGASLGLAFAHLVGRRWRAVRASLLVLIAIPHSALAIVLFTLFAYPLPIRFGTITQLIGHVTVALPFVALIVWTRIRFLDPSYEEQAADLGAPPMSTVTRVLLPLCAPGLVVAAMVSFAVSFNEIPLSSYLCIPASCRTVPVALSGRTIGLAPAPLLAISVLATLLSIAVLGAGSVAVRLTRP